MLLTSKRDIGAWEQRNDEATLGGKIWYVRQRGPNAAEWLETFGFAFRHMLRVFAWKLNGEGNTAPVVGRRWRGLASHTLQGAAPGRQGRRYNQHRA